MAQGLIARRLRKNTQRGVMLFGVELRDAQEEVFVRMVCDGLALGVAFSRAGFKSKAKDAPINLFHVPRVQARAQAILEARRTTGVVTLGEVTDMLKRVYAGAHSEGEYSSAHNAAFSLARLYGHVTDKATLEVIRRPSRDPDAPSEQALASWVESLPGLPAPGLEALSGPDASVSPSPQTLGLEAPRPGAPALPLGPQTDLPSDINWLEPGPSRPGPSGPELSNDIKGLATVPPPSENGAPVGPVTVAPPPRGQSKPLGPAGPGPRASKPKGSPARTKRVPVKKRVKSGAEKRKARKLKAEMKDLFG
jgi:hypothetical protein